MKIILSQILLSTLNTGANETSAHNRADSSRKHGESIEVSAEINNPVPRSKSSIERGRILYKKFCSDCHGEEGDGQGVYGEQLNPSPSDLTRVTPERSDYLLFLQMSLGSMAMPQQRAKLSEKERWSIVHYLRKLAEKGKHEASRPKKAKQGLIQ